MENLRCIAKPVTYVVLFGFLTLTLHVPAARAGMVNTEAVVSTAQAQQARDQIRGLLQREDVRRALLARGVSPDQLRARADSLTDEETQRLAAKIDRLPAGGNGFDLGDAIDLLVLVFLVLLITDILGLTDVFPFVKKPARR